jgi:hypothetical protein
MMNNRILLILTISAGLVASALALGCSDRPGVTDPATSGPPSFSAAIDRFEAPFFQLFVDVEQGLTVLPGASLEDLPALCADAEIRDLANWLVVVHPTREGGTVAHVLIRDKERSVIVWAAVPEENICELQDVQPLAVGTIQMTFTDDDFGGTSPGSDSFGERVEGTVANPVTGQRYHLQAFYRVVVLPDGTVKVPVEGFTRLTPIGG